ncbi:Tubulin-specific chaperone C [Oopsacas minuta]|uniref:Tubulin-specific chaperone C n=1 Tax=Oopsacas minuta TaxID=111878 RepID=A0AAV7KEL0_9METZ|nr:Tubulin-specific chaperone C [Oopsacas minuta]
MASIEPIALLSEEEKIKKQKAYEEGVAKRYEERISKKQQRKSNIEHKPEETVDYFWKEFNSQNSDINSMFEQLSEALEPNTIAKEIDVKLEIMQKYMNDSILFLNPFDLRIAQSTIKKLQADLTKEREKYAPRKKFGFKSRQKQTQNGGQVPKKEPSVVAKISPAPLPASKNSFVLKDRKNENIIITPEEVFNKDLLILNLDNCTLYIHSIPATVHMTNITNSQISFGPVKTSIMIHDCVNTKFSLACQQLRIHTSVKCDFYIHVTSRAIIEDSSGLRFAPFTNTYPNLQDDYMISGLDEKLNNWAIVNDFNWLSNNEASPNWRIIQEDQRMAWK